MLTNCPCPPKATLTQIPGVVCADDFGQLQKVAFQRIKDGAGTFNEFSSPSGIDLLASWVTKIAAANGTRIVLSPYIQAPATEPGEAITFGGGNDTPDGIEIPVGTNPTTFTGVLRSLPQSVVKAIKELACEAATGNLGVFLFDNKGQIKALKGATAGAYRLVRSSIAPTRTMGQGATAGRDSSAAPEGAGAWDRPIGEIIARRAIRTRNRDRDAAARFERVHTILSRGRA